MAVLFVFLATFSLLYWIIIKSIIIKWIQTYWPVLPSVLQEGLRNLEKI